MSKKDECIKFLFVDLGIIDEVDMCEAGLDRWREMDDMSTNRS